MPTLADILKKLTTKPNKPRSSADLKADFEAIDLKALEAQVDGLEAERRRQLLAGSDDDVTAISAELSAANMSLERALVARDELSKRIAEAVEREAAADLAKTRTTAAALRAEIAAAEAEINAAASTIDDRLKLVRTKVVALRQAVTAIAKATGEQVERTPEASIIRSRALNAISH